MYMKPLVKEIEMKKVLITSVTGQDSKRFLGDTPNYPNENKILSRKLKVDR